MMKGISSDATLGRIAAQRPRATRVFDRHGIDYWCGGGRSLAAACAETGVDPGRVLDEIEQELADAHPDEERWDEASLEALIDHIETSYHRPLERELARLEELAREVAAAHGDREPRLAALLTTFVFLRSDLEQHLSKEEQALFPEIRSGDGALTEDVIAMLEEDHTTTGQVLQTLRSLTDDFAVPEWAGNAYRSLVHGLSALEQSLHRHIHLESNILFPRALED